MSTDSSYRSGSGQSPPRGAAAKLEAILDDFAAQAGAGSELRITLGQLFDRMEERAFGLLLLLLVLPCCLPFVYVLPQIVSLPMLLLAGQMALGRTRPWLPHSLRSRSFAVTSIRGVVDRSRRYLAIAEWLAHPRLGAITGRAGSRVIGILLMIPIASILVPLPLTNTVPAVGTAMAAVGLIERDGLFVAGGLLLGLAWVAALVIGGHAAVSALLGLLSG